MSKILEQNKDVLNLAVQKFGKDHQLMKLFEEMAELQEAICKHMQNRDSTNHIAEEAADLMLTLCEIMYIFDIESDVEEWLAYKIKRLKDIIEKEGN